MFPLTAGAVLPTLGFSRMESRFALPVTIVIPFGEPPLARAGMDNRPFSRFSILSQRNDLDRPNTAADSSISNHERPTCRS
jgi:hypothetical protein